MRPLHEFMLEAIKEERRQRLASRRAFLKGGVKLAAGGTLAVATFGMPGFNRLTVRAQDFDDDIDVLNFALTSEHLGVAFYALRDQFDFGTDAFGQSIDERIDRIAENEETHRDTVISVIEDLGGTPVEEAEYDFGVTDAATFLATAATLENTEVSAYDGVAQFLESRDLLTTAGTIAAVEARHASYLNLITGVLPFPAAFETPLTPDEVLETLGAFIVEGGATPGVGGEEATPEA